MTAFPRCSRGDATGLGWVDRGDHIVAAGCGRDWAAVYGIGCNGHGLAQAPHFGTLLADRLAGDEIDDDLRAV